jgi:hypothetical protein
VYQNYLAIAKALLKLVDARDFFAVSQKTPPFPAVFLSFKLGDPY